MTNTMRIVYAFLAVGYGIVLSGLFPDSIAFIALFAGLSAGAYLLMPIWDTVVFYFVGALLAITPLEDDTVSI